MLPRNTIIFSTGLYTSAASSLRSGNMGVLLLLNVVFGVTISIHQVSCLLDNADRSDVMAVKRRLEDEKEQRLLLTNDVEMLMLKFAKLERQTGVSTSGVPMVLAAGIEGNTAKVHAVEEQLKLLQATFSSGSGSTYVRWGRTRCPGNGTDFVYKGYAAGSYYTHRGAAANYLCLPEEPIWNKVLENEQGLSGKIYGAEYQFDQRSRMPFFGKEIHQDDAPCAVCRAPRSAVLMVPGRNACYDGWNLEYSGYLASGHHGHEAASEFVCVDERPEVIAGGSAERNGKLFYFVEAVCGTLKCPPYVNGRELTCAVCTK